MNEFWQIPDNPATRRAKEIYLEFRNKRIETEKRFAPFCTCNACYQIGIKDKYDSDTMYHIKRVRRKYNKSITFWTHYCEEHGSRYQQYVENMGIIDPKK